MNKAIAAFMRWGTLWSTYGLILSVLLQIFARFFLPNTPPWTEESSRLFFIYAIAFSAGLAFESGEYVALDWFYEQMPAWLKQGLKAFIPLLCGLLFGIIAIYAVQFIQLGHAERSPGMKIRMSYVFFSLFVLAAALSYFTLRHFLNVLKTKAND